MVKFLVNDNVPGSVVRTVITYEDCASKFKDAVQLSTFPEMANSDKGLVTRVYVKVVSSGSVVDRVPITVLAAEFSDIVVAERAIAVGASFTTETSNRSW